MIRNHKVDFRRTNAALTIGPKGNSVVTVFDGASRATQFQQHLRQAGQGQNPPAPNQTLLPGSAGTVVTTLILDGNGRQTQLIDDRGDVTRWEFDTLDRETAMIFQDGSTRTNQYDEASNVVQYTDENGSVFANTFDALSRKTVVVIALAAGVADTTTEQYCQFDGLSRVTDAEDDGSAGLSGVAMFYDSISRVLEDSQVVGGNTRDITNTQFASYPATQFQFPGSSGRKLDNTFDALYRRTTLKEDSGGATIAAWQFFGPGRVAEVALGNGLTCTWMNNARKSSAVQGGTPGVPNPPWVALPAGQSADRLGYDGAGRGTTKRYLISGTGESGYTHPSAVVGFTTAFDRASNKLYERALHAEERSSLYEPFDSNQIPQGGYDSLDRLLQYQRGVLSTTGGCGGNGGGSIAAGGAITLPNTDSHRSYLLDSLGNWRNTQFTPVGGSSQTEIRQHNGLNEITRRSNAIISELINPTYDLNGNLTFDGTLTYQWDALNRLVAVSNGETPVGAYFYDALNRRVRKAIGDTNTDFVYFGWRCFEDRNPVGGEDSTDTPIAQYLWGIYLDDLIQLKLLAVTNDFEPNTILYPLQDLLYRTTALVDTSSPPVVREAYDTDAYGNTLIFRNTSGSTVEPITWTDSDTQVALPIAPTCPFIFTGQRFDAETDLYYYKRRYYSPVLGRFLSRDPIITKMRHRNSFEYAAARAVILTDKIGLQGHGPPVYGPEPPLGSSGTQDDASQDYYTPHGLMPNVGGGTTVVNPDIDPAVLQQLRMGGTGQAPVKPSDLCTFVSSPAGQPFTPSGEVKSRPRLKPTSNEADYLDCLANCISESQFDVGGALGTAFGALRVPKYFRGPTQSSTKSIWQTKVCRKITGLTIKEGLITGRVFLGLLIFEGFYDIGAETACVAICAGAYPGVDYAHYYK